MVSISSVVKGLVAAYFVVSGVIMYGTYGDVHRNASLTDIFATKLGLSVQSAVTKLELVGLFITILSGLQIGGAIAFQLGRLEGAHLLVCYLLLSPTFLPEFQHQYPLVPVFLVLHRGSLQLMAGLLVVLLLNIEARDMKAMTRRNQMIRPQNQNTTTENQNQNPTLPAVNENPTANQNSTTLPTGNQNQNPTLPAVNQNPNNRGWGILKDLASVAVVLCFLLKDAQVHERLEVRLR